MTVSEQTTTELTELTVWVPKRLVAMVEERVASGRYADASAVVDDALSRMDEEERQLNHLRELIQEGIDSGEGVELTDEVWDQIWQEAEERLARGEQPSPVVCS